MPTLEISGYAQGLRCTKKMLRDSRGTGCFGAGIYSPILGDPGAASRDKRMFAVKVYHKNGKSP